MKHILAAAAIVMSVTTLSHAQQFPLVDMMADRVVKKYQSSTCEQLMQSKGKHGPEEQKVVAFLRGDPQKRQEFFNRIAAPVMNKMFECGMIP